MQALARLRARLRLRQRFRDRVELKQQAELRWWVEVWDPVLRAGGFNPGDAIDFLDGEEPAKEYMGLRWQQARAEVKRVLKEAAIEDERFFRDKVVVDIGPGALGFPDACPARTSIGIEPLAERFAQHGLLLPESHATYLAVHAERMPLVSASVDVVLARNSLDHVEHPAQVLRETARVLRDDGMLILNVDLNHAPTATEPHTLTHELIHEWLGDCDFAVERQSKHGWASGGEGSATVIVARRNARR